MNDEYHVITIDDAYFIQSYHVKNFGSPVGISKAQSSVSSFKQNVHTKTHDFSLLI